MYFYIGLGTTFGLRRHLAILQDCQILFILARFGVFNSERVVYKHAIIKFILIYGFGGIGMALTVTMLDSLTVMDYRVIWFLESFLHF
jgi:hypothetical protein